MGGYLSWITCCAAFYPSATTEDNHVHLLLLVHLFDAKDHESTIQLFHCPKPEQAHRFYEKVLCDQSRYERPLLCRKHNSAALFSNQVLAFYQTTNHRSLYEHSQEFKSKRILLEHYATSIHVQSFRFCHDHRAVDKQRGLLGNHLDYHITWLKTHRTHQVHREMSVPKYLLSQFQL